MDYTLITSSINFANALLAIGAISSFLAVVYIAVKGADLVLEFLFVRSLDVDAQYDYERQKHLEKNNNKGY